MEELSGCQIPNLPNFSEGKARLYPQPIGKTIKRILARPWNYLIKRSMKRGYNRTRSLLTRIHLFQSKKEILPIRASSSILQPGDWVQVRSRKEIEDTLNPWKELKGCAFLDEMWKYCGTRQRVLKSMQLFLDERDYQVKKCSGVILLEGMLCQGTPVFGPCDRCCHLFWREEWVEKIDEGG